MGGHFWRRFISFLLGLGVLALVAGYAYQAGTHVAIHDATGGDMRTYGWHGGFFFPFLFFPFGLFLFFGLMKMLFWGGPRHWGGGYGGHRDSMIWGGPARLEEWHRHAHEPQAGTTTATPTAPGDPGRGTPT